MQAILAGKQFYDQAMVAKSEAGKRRLMDSLSAKCLQYDMKIHVKKTEVMKISRRKNDSLNITINGQKVEQVRQFKYLGSLLTEDGRSGTEIRARIGTATEAFNNKKVLLTKSLNKELKKQIVKSILNKQSKNGCDISLCTTA